MIEANECLESFYQQIGLSPNNMEDLDQKLHEMSKLVSIPNFPYDRRKPSLSELEVQYLREHGYEGIQ